MPTFSCDVLIVGGGPAGLSAALVLGRCRRRVLVLDRGKPRNYASRGLHGFLTRDGIPPLELLAIGREQLRPYDNITYRHAEVAMARRLEDHFEITVKDGSKFTSRKLLLATGMRDELPSIPEIESFYGRSVFHCPYCDGWEMRDQPLAIYGQEKRSLGLARNLLGWSRDLVLCTDGRVAFSSEEEDFLRRHQISVFAEKIAGLEGREGVLKQIVFANGDKLPRRALFFNTGQNQQCDLAAELGCTVAENCSVLTDHHEATNVPGVFVAGDASRDLQLAIIAAGEGANAAFAINKALLSADFPFPA